MERNVAQKSITFPKMNTEWNKLYNEKYSA